MAIDLGQFSRIDFWSLAAVPINMDFEGHPLSQGTAFFYMWLDQTYLVTAWHNFSGQHYQTNENLSSNGGRPSHVTVWWNPDGKPGHPKTSQRLALYHENGERRWTERREHFGMVDVVIMPVTPPKGMQAYPVNELPQGPTSQSIGGDLFIIGYPMKDQALQLPVWKRASLSSEPAIPSEIQPYWLVDTASRSGMSGSPVVQRVYPSEPSSDDFIARITNPGHRGVTMFDGVYSGRLVGKTKEDAQLGLVWPIWWIARLLREHLGAETYESGLSVELARGQRVLAAFREAMTSGGRGRGY